MIHYFEYFFLTFIFSTLFAIVGLGSSLVLIPLFTWMGLDFNFAKAIGAFVNGTTTLTHTVQNIRRKETALAALLPLVLTSGFFALLGAFSSQYIAESFQYVLFVLFIFLSVTLLYSMQSTQEREQYKLSVSIYLFVAFVAFISALLGVGGGAIYLPLLMYTGMGTKESIYATSAMIPLVSISAFLVYTTFVSIEWVLLFCVALGALLGGFVGARLTHKIKNENFLKIFISVILLCIAVEMSYNVWSML